MTLNLPSKGKHYNEKTRVLRCIKEMKKNLNKSRCNYSLKFPFCPTTSGILISCFPCNSCSKIGCLPIILPPRYPKVSSFSPKLCSPPPSPCCPKPSLNIVSHVTQSSPHCFLSQPRSGNLPLSCSPTLGCDQPTDSIFPPTDCNSQLKESTHSCSSPTNSFPVKNVSPPADSCSPPTNCWSTSADCISSFLSKWKCLVPFCHFPATPLSKHCFSPPSSPDFSCPQLYYNSLPENDYFSLLPRCASPEILCSWCAPQYCDPCRPKTIKSCPKLVNQSLPLKILIGNQRSQHKPSCFKLFQTSSTTCIIKPFYIQSYELRGSKFLKCICRSHFGLQDYCPRTGCNGSAACLTSPPSCLPSQIDPVYFAIPKCVLPKFYASTGDSCQNSIS